jgi:N-succinyldiaminopimelate aminotransferase
MNPRLGLLQPYPFERLRALLGAAKPPANLRPISLGLGEPQHPTPAVVKEALAANLGALSKYPVTLGLPELRTAISEWLARRHGIPAPDVAKQVIPVNGSREALFSIAQAVLDPDERDALVAIPNPFYQVYEGSTLLAGARPYFINAVAANGLRPDFEMVSDTIWQRIRLMYVCSPSNPHGRVMTMDDWKRVFELSDKHGFVVVSDECYSEIYFDEARPPLGALAAARKLGRDTYPRLVALGSLSKRSSAPGLRSGYAAGDAAVIEKYLQYRTYFGSTMSNASQMASIAAWKDESHVIDSRRLYREKFAAFYERVNPVLPLQMPDAGFYFWANVGGIACPGNSEELAGDAAFARDLFAETHITVLPGSYIARDAHGVNPGRGFVRMALVSTVDDAVEAADRMHEFLAHRPAAALAQGAH